MAGHDIHHLKQLEAVQKREARSREQPLDEHVPISGFHDLEVESLDSQLLAEARRS